MRNNRQVVALKELPNPITDAELEGLELVSRRDRMSYYKLSTEQPMENDEGLIGIEYEVPFVPSLVFARKLKNFFLANVKNTTTEASQRYRSLGDLKSEVGNILWASFRPLLVDEPHYDGGGLECVFFPATPAAHQVLKPLYESILLTMKAYEFDASYSGAGIHLNIDNTLFGATADEQLSAQERMLYFIFQIVRFRAFLIPLFLSLFLCV